jgi:hypothetical protein
MNLLSADLKQFTFSHWRRVADVVLADTYVRLKSDSRCIYVDSMQDLCSTYVRFMLDRVCRMSHLRCIYVVSVQDLCCTYVGLMSDLCRTYVGLMSDLCRTYVGLMSDLCRTYVGLVYDLC